MKNKFLLVYSLLFILFSISCDPKKEEIILPTIDLSIIDVVLASKAYKDKIVNVKTNSDWIIILSETKSDISWLNVSPQNGNAGEHNITISVKGQNMSNDTRKAYIQVKSGDLIKTIAVTQEGVAKLETDVTELMFKERESQELTFTVNTIWKINLPQNSWFSVSKASGIAGTHTITITPNAHNKTNADKIGSVDFDLNDNEITHSILLTQKPLNTNLYYQDRDVVQLFTATQGDGIDLVIMGDGFTTKDLIKEGSGRYKTAMMRAAEDFFSVEPYKAYRSYFNVYMVIAESEGEGVNGEFRHSVNNKFSSTYGKGTAISCDYDLCKEYALRLENIKGASVDIGDVTTILVLNSKKYAGTCMLWSDGHSIAMCPMAEASFPYNFRGIINHEAGGHGFAKLADEYISHTGKRIPHADVNDARRWQSIGFYPNMDFTNDLSQILWRDFNGIAKYSAVNVYEGGYYYTYGVWRPELNSCMNNNVPYYNAPSRWAIVKRIMALAGQNITFEEFVNNDVIDTQSLAVARTKAYEQTMPPLAPPIVIR